MLTEADVRNAIQATIDSEAAQSWSLDFNFRDGTMDSLDHVSFLLRLHEEHGFAFRDEDAARLNTIRAVLEFAAGPK